MPRQPFVRKVGLLFLANLVIAPVADTFALSLLSGEPRLVFATDIAGVPIVVYVLVPVAFAVIGFTVCGVFILGGLRRPRHRRQYIAVLFGAVAGARF